MTKQGSLWICAFMVLASACGDGGGAPARSGDGADAGTKSEALTLEGHVFDADDGRSLDKVRLATSADVKTESTKDGTFSLTSETKLEALTAARSGYAKSYRPAPEAGGYVDLFLKELDERRTFRADEGVTVELKSGERLIIPKDAVLNEKRERVAGPVTVELAAVDGGKRAHASALPGGQSAQRKNGQKGVLSIGGALSIRLLDPSGKELDVDRDKNVVAEIPQREAELAAVSEVYSFDEKRGKWVEEGRAELVKEGGKAYLRFDVEHLSWWSLGRFYGAVGCVRACVEDESGERIAGAQVWAVGTKVAGVGTFFSDDSGCGAVDSVAGSEVVLIAQTRRQTSKSKRVTIAKAPAHSEDGIEGCTDGGTLVVDKKRDSACPSAFVSCRPGSGGTGGPIAVEGKAVDSWGNPVAGVSLQVAGRTVTTNAEGVFSVENVDVPYTIIQSDSEANDVAYLGVTRADPQIVVTSVRDQYSATLYGTTTGGVGYPLPTGYMTNITIDGKVSATFDARQLGGNAGSWSAPGPAQWTGQPTLSATLFALQHNMLTYEYTGMGFRKMTLMDGGEYEPPATDLTLSPVTTHTLSGSISGPAGLTVSSVVLYIGTFIRSISNPEGSYAFPIPNGIPEDVSVMLAANATINGSSLTRFEDVAHDATSLDVAFQKPVQVVAPADDTSNFGPSDRFELDVPAGTISQLYFSWADNLSGEQQIYSSKGVLFTGSSISLQEILDAGIELPRGRPLGWTAQNIGLPDVDSYLGEWTNDSRPLSYTSQRTLIIAP